MKPGMILYREELQMLVMMDRNEIGEAMEKLALRFLFGTEPETDNWRVERFLSCAIPKQDDDEEAYQKRVDSARKAGQASNDSRRKANERSTEINDRSTTVNDRSTDFNDRSTSVNKQEQEQEHKQEQEQEQEQYSARARASVFRKPTVEEVKAFCDEHGYTTVDPEAFWNFYESKGWMIGKNHMKSWEAAVRTWQRNRFGQETKKSSEPQMQTHEWNYDELEKLAFKRALGG